MKYRSEQRAADIREDVAKLRQSFLRLPCIQQAAAFPQIGERQQHGSVAKRSSRENFRMAEFNRAIRPDMPKFGSPWLECFRPRDHVANLRPQVFERKFGADVISAALRK